MTDVLLRPPPRADARISYGADAAQVADLWLPARAGSSPAPLVIAIHGGYWRAENDRAHLGHLCLALRDAGLAVLSLEYRRLGMPGGGLRGMLEDVRAGVAAGRSLAGSHPIDAGPPVVLGHSAGGQLALWLGKEVAVRGVVALAPISDLRRARALGLDGGIVDVLFASAGVSEDEACALASPIERLPMGARQIVIHGALDTGVPVTMSEAYAARARALGERADDVDLRVLPGAGHLEVIDPLDRAWEFVRGAVCQVAGLAAAPSRPT